jgi:hypothetical protein
MAEQTCYGEHAGHICVLAMHQEFEEIKAVTKNPQHICFNCGRVADAEKNLCNPRPLK